MDREGSVAKVFQKMNDIIETNDGTRSFEWVTDTCHDQQAPFQYNQETRIALTSTQHLISDFSKGFLTVKVQAGFKLQGITAVQIKWLDNYKFGLMDILSVIINKK